MATLPYKWRTSPSGTEGVNTVYADSDTGSDLWGDGTRSNPYQTLGKSYRATDTRPDRIVCRGRFSEMMSDGNHNCTIVGDYLNAAVFDGADYFIIYGFRHSNFIIVNTAVVSNDLLVTSGAGLFAGVGGAAGASLVGNAPHVYGVAGSSVIIDNSGLYWGVIGGTTAVRWVTFSRPKAGAYKISLGSYQNSGHISNNTIYGCRIANRQRRITTGGTTTFATSIFADFDMFADDAVTFNHVLFASDCGWYYKDLRESGTPQLRIVVGVGSSATPLFTVDNDAKTMTICGGGVTDIPTAVQALYDDGRITTKATFTNNCVFTDETAQEIFNNPEKQDFTLRLNGSGVISSDTYFGAFPPALAVPIMDNSSGVAGSWDENTCDGLIEIADNEIKIDEGSNAVSGSVLSKIVQIDPSKVTLSAIFSTYASKFTSGFVLWKEDVFGDTYRAGAPLPIGRYIVRGAVIYDGYNVEDGAVLVVSQENTTFANDNVESTLVQLVDSNISNVVFVRTTAAIYTKIKKGDGLQRGGVYLNCGNANITYRGRTIVPGESFVAVNAVDDFNASSGYEIGVMFDDTRAPFSEWIPAQLLGEYFVCKESGAVKLDTRGIPVSSGNYLSYQSAANGGYATSRRTRLKQRYIQFRFDINRIYDNTD